MITSYKIEVTITSSSILYCTFDKIIVILQLALNRVTQSLSKTVYSTNQYVLLDPSFTIPDALWYPGDSKEYSTYLTSLDKEYTI